MGFWCRVVSCLNPLHIERVVVLLARAEDDDRATERATRGVVERVGENELMVTGGLHI